MDASELKQVGKNVCVIGAGIIGLSTAISIQQNISHANMTIIADSFTPNTTSDLSAGFWKPFWVKGTSPLEILKWGRATWNHLIKIANSTDSETAGVFTVSGYQLFEKHTPGTEYQYLHPRFSAMTIEEMKLYGEDFLSGVFFTSLMCECNRYLPYLMNIYKEKGGTIIHRKVNTFSELHATYDIIVNCAGNGAHELVPDKYVRPIRGQIIKVKAPWIKHFYITGDAEYYIFPGKDLVTLGGTHQLDNSSTLPDMKDKKDIMTACCKLMPSLKNAEVAGDYCGLRPYRTTGVRIDFEKRTVDGKAVYIIHNYGHGGSGITIHWGCAIEAADLVQQCLKHLSPKL